MNDTKQIEKRAEQDTKDSQAAIDFAESLQIENNESLKQAVEIVQEIKDKKDEVENTRKEFTAPLNESLKKINAFFKPVTTTLTSAEKKIQEKMTAFVSMRNSARQSVLEAIPMADEKDRPKLLSEADKLLIDKVKGLSVSDKESYEVVDMEAYISGIDISELADYLEVNPKKLKSFAKAMGEQGIDLNQFGIKKTQHTAVTVRRTKK